MLNGCIFGELATNDKLAKSKEKGATNVPMIKITSKCKTSKTTPGALDPMEDLVTMCKSKDTSIDAGMLATLTCKVIF